MTTLACVERDRREPIELLIQAAEIAGIEGRPPESTVDRKSYASHELLQVATLLPDEPLQATPSGED
jgi:hypothetical protein